MRWSGQEDSILIDNYRKLSYKEISELIYKVTKVRRTPGATRARANNLGILRQKDSLWSEKEDMYLRDNYMHKTYTEMSKHLNRSEAAIFHRVDNLKLDKKKARWTEEELANLQNGIFSNKRTYGTNHTMKSRLKNKRSNKYE